MFSLRLLSVFFGLKEEAEMRDDYGGLRLNESDLAKVNFHSAHQLSDCQFGKV